MTINDVGGSQATATSAARVDDPPVLATGGFTIQATEGQASATQTVATFIDPGGAEAPTAYSASITWGDGTAAKAGAITGPDSHNVFTVSGSRTYAEEGTPSVQVIIHHGTAPDAVVQSTARVADAPLAAAGKTILSGWGTAFNGVVAIFTDADPNGTVGDYRAIITWGDGTSSAGAISADGSGGFLVSGSHQYSVLGPYTVAVTIQDIGGSRASATPQLLTFAYLPGGSFALGDETVADVSPGATVLWWGAHWAGENSLSGESAPASFKGFVQASSMPPRCGGGGTTAPGNSSGPPSSVPTYMAVLVTSTVTQSGSKVSGDEVHIVVIKTDPGYGPSPGHAGTGTIVARIC
ncbi:MAG TPA: hypothetical protein VMS64_29670 [Candidatus Methylomirabilis sp.]|nr:hypothetical protein [Candidatus Methylomirabilis sp.]